MKQINLFPKNSLERTLLWANPFWKQYLAGSMIMVLLSLSFSYWLYQDEQKMMEDNRFIQDWNLKLKDELAWFNQIAQEKGRLEEELKELRENAAQNHSIALKQPSSVLHTLETLIRSLPPNVWLENLQCRYLDDSITLHGYSHTKEDIQRFVDDGLKNTPGVHDVIIHNLRRLDDPGEYQFSLSLQFTANGDRENSKEN